MSLEYALVTDSSLPEEVQGSDHYVSVNKEQWLDLVDYSSDLVTQDPTQRILFLIVAKGTDEQEAADAADREAVEAAALARQNELQSTTTELEQLKQAALEKEKAAQEKRAELRQKSKSIFNALYGR